MGIAYLLGQLSLPPHLPTAIRLLHDAALLASTSCPQPAYAYALLLLSELDQVSVPPTVLSSFIPPGSSVQLEARRHLGRAAYHHFLPAHWELMHM